MNSGPDQAPSVVAIVWTYDRFEQAERCVSAVRAQVPPPDAVVVVDIASPDRTGDRLAERFPDIEIVRLTDNSGPGAAIAAALSQTSKEPVDFFWLVEDDSIPDPTCLSMLLTRVAEVANPGLIGPAGAMMRLGQWYPEPSPPVGSTRHVDFVYLDGALLSAAAARDAGVPMTDYFIMMVDVEYPLRLAGLGYDMVLVGLPYRALQLGAASPDSSWRSYYQTRNHLRMAIDHRSAPLFAGFVIRTAKHVVYALLHRDWPTLSYRAQGARDGLLGRMGRRIDPPRGEEAHA